MNNIINTAIKSDENVTSINAYDLDGFRSGYENGSYDLSKSKYRTRPDKKIISDDVLKHADIKYGFARDSYGLIIPLVDIDNQRNVIQYQLITDIANSNNKFLNKGDLKGRTPVVLLGGNSFVTAKDIIVCESPFKAAAVYQALVYNQSAIYYAVVGAVNVAGVAKVADYLVKINQGAKVIIGCDNDEDKDPKKPINNQVLKAIERNCVRFVMPPKGFKDFDQMLAANRGGDCITDLFNNPKSLESLSQIKQPVKDELILINRQPVTDGDLIRLKALNDKYSHTVVAGKHRILSLTSCPIDGDKYNLEPLSEFPNYFLREPRVNGVNLGKAWLQWSGNNLYSGGMGYYPNEDKCPSDVFNVFRGFGCEPVQGDTGKLLNFINEIFCGGDVAAYDYLIKWLAHLFQKPMEKPTVAILAKSDEGTGKGTLYTLLKRMLCANAHQLNGAFQITGRFQSVIVNKLLIFGDEVDLTSKAVADRAKGIISEPTISIERKGYEPEVMPLYARFIFAGNHSRLISAGTRERRYLILEPSVKRIGDHEYWKDLYSTINGVGANALLHYLLNFDIAGFNPNSVPATKALIEEKIQNLKPALMFLHEELSKDGNPFNGVARIQSNKLVELYKDWYFEKIGTTSMAALRSAIGKALVSCGLKPMGRNDTKTGKYYDLPTKEVFKGMLAKSLGHEVVDIF